LTNYETAHFPLARANVWITDEVVNELKTLLSYLILFRCLRRLGQESFRTTICSTLP